MAATDPVVPAVRVLTMAGRCAVEVSPIPPTIGDLKLAVQQQLDVPQALQRLVAPGSLDVLENVHVLDPMGAEVVMIIDETPLWTWDVEGNPGKRMLEVDGGTVKCPALTRDFVNLVTREPLRSGAHYFEFHMHCIGDEQWCGVTRKPEQAGHFVSGRSLDAWVYYAGRRGSWRSDIVDGHGALHAEKRAVAPFDNVQATGDVIGMLVDLSKGVVVFDLNGKLQGACAVPIGVPLWVLTQVDTDRDHMELKKLPLEDAPATTLAAVGGTLLDPSKGQRLDGLIDFAEAGLSDFDYSGKGC